MVSSENNEAWARIHVVRGAAPQRLVLRQDEPAQLVIGSDPSAHIHLADPSVAPRQFDVLWDGHHLWLEDTLRLGRTFVNGQLLNEWTLVHGDVLVSFGAVRLWIVAGGPQPLPSAPDFAAVERARTGAENDVNERRSPTVRLSLTPEVLAQLNEAGASLS